MKTNDARTLVVGGAGFVGRYIEDLKNVTFEVNKGGFLDVIGQLGAGKSTLLRTTAGILPPPEERVLVNGHVTTLLSLGIGFNAELTGRDNVSPGGLTNRLTPKESPRK